MGIWKNIQHHISLGSCKFLQKRYYYTPIRVAKIKETIIITGEDVKQQEFPY